jgi:hypothetical protein
MADALFNVGGTISAQDWLEITSAVNRLRNEKNSLLKGVGSIVGVNASSIPDSGFDTSFRRFSTANDEEIANTIMSNASGIDFKDEKAFKNWYDRKNYPPTLWPKVVDQWYKTMGEKRSTSAEIRAEETASFAADTARHQDIMRPLERESKELSVKSAKGEADKKRNEKYSERLASKIAMKAYDYYNQDMDRETALETAIEEERAQFKKGGIAGGYDSAWARSAYVKAREKFNKLTKDTGTTKAVYDTRNGEQRWMTEDDIQAINKAEGAETILPASAEPADDQQVSGILAASAAQILYDDAALAAAEVDFETARELLTKWSQDKSWMVRFNEILPEHTKLHKDWHDTVKEVMAWWKQGTDSTTVEGTVID